MSNKDQNWYGNFAIARELGTNTSGSTAGAAGDHASKTGK